MWTSHREERRRVRVLGSARPTNQEHRATPLELFFRLVYIFAATQVTAYMACERRLPRGASGRDPGGGGVDAHGGAPVPRDLRAGVRRQPRRGLSSTTSLAW